MENTTTTSGSASPSSGWYVVALMSLLIASSYIDRHILSVLAAPVAAELKLSDPQLGLLLGVGFALLYSLAGLPLAHLLDRSNRIRIVSAGVLLWSGCTIASSLAQNFAQLLVLRAGVALGEAVILPGTISLIADLFLPASRHRPTAMFSAVGTLMAGGAFIVGAAAVQLAELMRPSFDIQEASWRITLVLVGLPGIPIALLLLATTKDPRGASGTSEGGASRLADLGLHLATHVRFYLCFYIALGCIAAAGLAAVAWLPTMLHRVYGLDVAEASYSFGFAALPAGVIGTIFWTWLVQHLDRAGRAGPLEAFAAGSVIMAAAAAMIATSPPLWALQLAMGTFIAGSAVLTVLPALCVHAVGPARMRAKLASLNLMAANLIGLSVGTLAIPLLANRWAGAHSPLAMALFAFTTAAAAITVPCLLYARSAFIVARACAIQLTDCRAGPHFPERHSVSSLGHA